MRLPRTSDVGQWSPDSWRAYPMLQPPEYPDGPRLAKVLDEVRQLPPLVVSWEILQLRQQLAEAARGSRFVLQADDCADDCRPSRITDTLKLLLQMSLVLAVDAQVPVIRVGPFAGPLSRHRAQDEPRDGVTPDPQLLLRGYERAALTLNFVRSLIKGGFADLSHPEHFDMEWMRHSPLAAEYARVVETSRELLAFQESILGVRVSATDRIDLYTAHEAFNLGYEAAQTRRVPRRVGYFDLSTHFPWVGLHANQPGGAHVEYLRGIKNPVALKVGCDTSRETVARWLDTLDPRREPGRLTLLHGFGASRIGDELPRLIEAVRSEGGNVLWICNPMDGNTRPAAGARTGNFADVCLELDRSFDIHRAMGQQLGGVHIELTGENVTEWAGGSSGADLARSGEAGAAPRLNGEQAIALAFLMARKMKERGE